MSKIFFDTETCGLHGMAVLIQYAVEDGPIILYDVWGEPVHKTLSLIEWFMENELIGFNLTFDMFHLCKLYTVFKLLPDHDITPEDYIDLIGSIEPLGRDGPCLKPKNALDLFLHARSGPYQSTMDRKDIRIKKVPSVLAYQLAAELEKRIPLKDIYFARRADNKADKWQVFDIEDEFGDPVPDFKDVVLKFKPSSALKALAVDALGLEVTHFKDIGVDSKFNPEECGWAPFAMAIGKPGNWKGTWPEVIQRHIDHWRYNGEAREYANDDVDYTRRLYHYFGCPELGDDNSILACMVAAVRWRGYKIDIEKIKEQRQKAIERSAKAPKAPNRVKDYIWPHLTEDQKTVIGGSTAKVVLEEIATWTDCEHDDGCKLCPKIHVAQLAQDVIDARTADKEREMYDKLLQAGRLHASLKIIGALSGRMSGADDLNVQGIKNTKEVRSCFPLALDGMFLNGGDFESFEVTIAVAIYKDEKLIEDIKSDKKIHAFFGLNLYPEETYESIIASKGTDNDLYTESKRGVFAEMYMGNGYTHHKNLGVTIEQGDKAHEEWLKRYPGIAKSQKRITDMFCSMRQPKGTGTPVEWHDPADKIETLLGFPRYFTLENRICKALFDLGEKPPKSWQQLKIKVVRRDREQFATGAVRSALFGAAFSLQNANTRAGGNHEIQGTGAGITKRLQCKLWELQPCGIKPWVIQPLNIHDEVMAPSIPEVQEDIKRIVKETVESFKPMVPLIGIDWKNNMKTWAEK